MRRPERAFYLTLGAALSPIPMPWLDALFTLPLPSPGYPLITACFVIAVLANISAIERLWTIGRMMREKEHAAEENLAAQESLSPNTPPR
jgi:hypothetical protein